MATIVEVERLLGTAEAAFRDLSVAVRALEVEPDEPDEPDEPGPGDLPKGTIAAMRLNADTGLKPPWHDVRVVAADRITRVSHPVRAGSLAYRVEVRPGDKPSSSGERSELLTNPKGFIREGDIWYFAGSTLFPEDWEQCPDSSYQIFWQLHGVGDTLSPAVSLRAARQGIVLRLRGGANDTPKEDVVVSPTLNHGRWNDFLILGKAGGSDSTGRIALWHRVAGDQWAQACDLHIATTHGHGQYFRQGLYRSAFGKTNVLYHDCAAFGNSLAEVVEVFPDRALPR